MKQLNYRHGLRTINEKLADTNHRVECTIKNGDCVYTLAELANDGRWVTCGFFYKKSDAAEIANKLLVKFDKG